jgi:Zinc carboxypeptidase
VCHAPARGTLRSGHEGPHVREGRQLLYATVGHGPDVFWLQARIHGNEVHVTEAVLQVLKYVASSGSAEARQIRDRARARWWRERMS